MIKINLVSVMGAWQARHHRELSLRELGEQTGLSASFLHRFKQGQIKNLNLDKLEALCRFFDCTPNDLLWALNEQVAADE
jgi:DNA-binding Xre family transcriptional regulator